MKFIIASLFAIASVHALPINNLQVELTPVEIAATYTADANAALKSCQGWFDSVCSDSLKKITNKFASQKITDCNSVDLEASALAQRRLSTCAKRWLVSSCKEDVEGLVQDMITLGANRVRAKAEAEKAVVAAAKTLAAAQAAARVAEQAASAQAKAVAEAALKAAAEAEAKVAAAAKAAEVAAKIKAADDAFKAATQARLDLEAANSKLTAFASTLKVVPFKIGAIGAPGCTSGGACWATNANKAKMKSVCDAWDPSIGQAYVMAGVKKFGEVCGQLKKGLAANSRIDYGSIGKNLNSAVGDIQVRIAPKIAAFNAALASATAAIVQASAVAAQARLTL